MALQGDSSGKDPTSIILKNMTEAGIEVEKTFNDRVNQLEGRRDLRNAVVGTGLGGLVGGLLGNYTFRDVGGIFDNVSEEENHQRQLRRTLIGTGLGAALAPALHAAWKLHYKKATIRGGPDARVTDRYLYS
jgi:hypothetical protein